MATWQSILSDLRKQIEVEDEKLRSVLNAARRVVDRHRLRPCPDGGGMGHKHNCSICNLGEQLDRLDT